MDGHRSPHSFVTFDLGPATLNHFKLTMDGVYPERIADALVSRAGSVNADLAIACLDLSHHSNTKLSTDQIEAHPKLLETLLRRNFRCVVAKHHSSRSILWASYGRLRQYPITWYTDDTWLAALLTQAGATTKAVSRTHPHLSLTALALTGQGPFIRPVRIPIDNAIRLSQQFDNMRTIINAAHNNHTSIARYIVSNGVAFEKQYHILSRQCNRGIANAGA